MFEYNTNIMEITLIKEIKVDEVCQTLINAYFRILYLPICHIKHNQKLIFTHSPFGYDTLLLMLREEHRLKVFEKRVAPNQGQRNRRGM